MTEQLQSSTLVLSQNNAEQITASPAANQDSVILRYRVPAGGRYDFVANNPMHYIWMSLMDTATTPAPVNANAWVTITAARASGDGTVTLFEGPYALVSQDISNQLHRAMFQEGISLRADRVITVTINAPVAVNTGNMKIMITGRMWD